MKEDKEEEENEKAHVEVEEETDVEVEVEEIHFAAAPAAAAAAAAKTVGTAQDVDAAAADIAHFDFLPPHQHQTEQVAVMTVAGGEEGEDEPEVEERVRQTRENHRLVLGRGLSG